MTKRSKIPEFANYQEEAEFWDTHDFTDFEDETTPVDVNFIAKSSDIVPVHLPPEVLSQLEDEANHLGMSTSALAGMWILEKLQNLPKNHLSS